MRRSTAVENYWMKYYVSDEAGLCSLCGNSGFIDTRTTAISAASVNAGRKNYCICPNGQTYRVHAARIERLKVRTKIPRPGELRDRAILGGEPSL